MTRMWAGKSTNHDSVPGRDKIFSSSSECFNQLWCPTYPPCSMSTWAFCPGCEADHSFTCSAGVKNEWSCIAALQHAFMTSAGTSLVLPYCIHVEYRCRRSALTV